MKKILTIFNIAFILIFAFTGISVSSVQDFSGFRVIRDSIVVSAEASIREIEPSLLSGLSEEDKELFYAVLSGDSEILEQTVTENFNKVYFKNEDDFSNNSYQNPNYLEGRTVYLELESPVEIGGKKITILRFKGVRPVFDSSGLTGEHKGHGYVKHVLKIDSDGNIYVEKGQPSPAGSILSDRAEHEYKIMKENCENESKVAVDYPVAWGEYKNIYFGEERKKLGFVVSGMESEDIRMMSITSNQLNQFKDADIYLGTFVVGTDRINVLSEEQAGELMLNLGKILREYHKEGYFHRYPHHGNIGIDGENIIMRDLDTTVKRNSLEGDDYQKSRQEAGYRFLDFLRIVFDLLEKIPVAVVYDGETDYEYLNLSGFVRPFLKGYFSDINMDTESFENLVQSCQNIDYVYKTKNLSGIGYSKMIKYVKLNAEEPVFGLLWQNLIDAVDRDLP